MTAVSFVLSKLVRTALTLLLVVTVVFVVLRTAGDPLLVLLPPDTDPAVVEQYRARWGLDRPMLEQYAYYVSSVFKGDLGRSFRDGRDAIEVVMERLPKTLELGAAAMLLAIVI